MRLPSFSNSRAKYAEKKRLAVCFSSEYLFICRLPFIKSKIIANFKYCIHNTWQELAISIDFTRIELGTVGIKAYPKGSGNGFHLFLSWFPPNRYCLLCKTNCRLLCAGIQCALLFYRLAYSWIHTYHVHRTHMPNVHYTERKL